MTKSEIQLVKSLGEKKTRNEMGLFVAEGDKFIRELIDSPLRVYKIFQRDDSTNEAQFEGGDVELISPKEMERISQLKSANSSLALVEMPRHTFDPAALSGRLTLLLDGVQNPGNLGTIIRLAEWFGVEDVICSPTSADCFNPKVVQATMGAILRVRVHYLPLVEVITAARAQSVPIYGADLSGESIYTHPLNSSALIVMGSEGSGLSAEVEALITDSIFIPPYPVDAAGSESLNVAVAAAIVCSEFRRRTML